MTEATIRDAQPHALFPQRVEPTPPEGPARAPVPTAPTSVEPPAPQSTPLDLLAATLVGRNVPAPGTVGLLGGAGSGKSFALDGLLARLRLATPPVATCRLDAAMLDGEPATAIAAALHESLASAAPDLGREAAHAVQDPLLVARDAAERHDAAQRRLETERRGLDELDGRRARLADTILYDTPGSQVDAYARANRSRIETALAGFGIGGDPIRSYKDFVRALAEAGSAGGRTSLATRAFWSFKGQFRLLATAVILAAVGVALGLVIADRSTWLTWLRGQSDSMLPVAAWMETHVSWLGVGQTIAFIAAGLALLLNIWRAVRFLQPIRRGYGILAGDIAARRHDLDGAFAHQTRRVDVLTSEVEAAGRRAAEAERRAGAVETGAVAREPSPFEAPSSWARATNYLAALDRQLDGAAGRSDATGPGRVVVALDGLEGVPPARAGDLLDAFHRLLAGRRHLRTILALDPHGLGDTAEGRRRLERWISIPVQVTALDQPNLLRRLLGASQTTKPSAPTDGLVASLSPAEIDVLAALGPIAGATPRALKRFTTLVQLARGAEPATFEALAAALALQEGGTAEEQAAVRAAHGAGDDAAPVEILPAASPRLRRARELAPALAGSVTRSVARKAADRARLFSFDAPGEDVAGRA